MADTNGTYRVQYAALPYRVRQDGEVQLRLVTSRETRRWVIPKGWPMKGIPPHKAAAREAYEEAGLLGSIASTPLGIYRYDKRLSATRSVLCEVMVFPMKVKRYLKKWPERSQRVGFWFSIETAASVVQEPELASLILEFGTVMAERHAEKLAKEAEAAAAKAAQDEPARTAPKKKAAAKKAEPKTAEPKKVEPKKAAPKKAAPKKAAPKKAALPLVAAPDEAMLQTAQAGASDAAPSQPEVAAGKKGNRKAPSPRSALSKATEPKKAVAKKSDGGTAGAKKASLRKAGPKKALSEAGGSLLIEADTAVPSDVDVEKIQATPALAKKSALKKVLADKRAKDGDTRAAKAVATPLAERADEVEAATPPAPPSAPLVKPKRAKAKPKGKSKAKAKAPTAAKQRSLPNLDEHAETVQVQPSGRAGLKNGA